MEYINVSKWDKREAFELYSGFNNPFFSITTKIDVTNVKRLSKTESLSFYCLMVWVCTKAVNSVPEFRVRIHGDRVVRIDEARANFTFLKKGSEQFMCAEIPWDKDYRRFCERAEKHMDAQKKFIEAERDDNNPENDDSVIYFSCTPWFDFESVQQPHAGDVNDCIPRIVWGKYFEEDGRLKLHFTVDVNHRVIDGYLLGKLIDAVNREIEVL